MDIQTNAYVWNCCSSGLEELFGIAKSLGVNVTDLIDSKEKNRYWQKEDDLFRFLNVVSLKRLNKW